MAAAHAAPSINEDNPKGARVSFNGDVKVLHAVTQKLYSDIKSKDSGFMASPNDLQAIIDCMNEILSGMSGEDPFLKYISVLLCELKVLKIVLFKSFGKAEEELKRLSSSLTKKTTSMIYLDEFLRRFTEREALEDGKVAELADHYQAKVERTLKKLCSFLKENIVEETIESEQENDPVTNDINDTSQNETSSSSIITKSRLVAKKPKKFTVGLRSKRALWSDDAVSALVHGVNRYGVGNWKKILESKSAKRFPTSDNVAIKDKWRNLVKYGYVVCKNDYWVLNEES